MRESLRGPSPLVGLGAALLVVLTVFLGADLLSLAVGFHSRIPPAPLAPGGSPSPAASPGDRVSRNLETLMRRSAPPSPSTSPGASPSPGAEVAVEPEVARGLDLQGVMLGGGVGIAVLQVDGQAHTVSEGDRVGDLQVVRIEEDRVLLRQGDRTFPVGLSGAPALGVRAEGGPPVLPDPGDVPLPPDPAPLGDGPPALPAAPGSGGPPPASGGRLTRQEMEAFLDQGAALARDVRGLPAPGAEGRGVRLEFRNPSNALARLGLKDGDVVLSMNGQPIRTPEELYNSYLILRNTPSVEFELLRGGQPASVRYEFPEVEEGP